MKNVGSLLSFSGLYSEKAPDLKIEFKFICDISCQLKVSTEIYFLEHILNKTAIY